MGQTREQRIIKQLAGKVQKQTPIATDMFIPNHSGDHSAGKTGTPVNDLDIANKFYVDSVTFWNQVAGVLSPKTATSIQLNQPITVGVDDTGHDVKFYGATSGKYLEWDESENELFIEGTQNIHSPEDTTTSLLIDSYPNYIKSKNYIAVETKPYYEPDTTAGYYYSFSLGGYIRNTFLAGGEYISKVYSLKLSPYALGISGTNYIKDFKMLDMSPIIRTSIITNMYGIHYNPIDQVGNTYTNTYGIKLENMVPATTLRYAIHTGTGLIHLGDDVEIAQDNDKLSFGATTTDFQLYSDGTDACVDYTGNLKINGTVGISATITTAALTPGGSQGSMTFVDGILTAQTAAT